MHLGAGRLGCERDSGRNFGSLGQDFGSFGDAQNDCVGARRAAGDEDIDGDVPVEWPVKGAAINEYVGCGWAGTDGNDRLGSANLTVHGLDGADRILCDGTGDAQNVGVAWATFETHAELLGIVARGETGDDFNVAAVATARVHVEDPWTAAPAIAYQSIPELHGVITFISIGCSVWGQIPPMSSRATRATITNLSTGGSFITSAAVLRGGPHQMRVSART